MFIRNNRRSKIVATVGPASSSPDMLRSLFLAGVDTFRLNFSHGARADHAEVYRNIRVLEQEHDAAIAVLQDLQGPKIRIGVWHMAGSISHVDPRSDLSLAVTVVKE